MRQAARALMLALPLALPGLPALAQALPPAPPGGEAPLPPPPALPPVPPVPPPTPSGLAPSADPMTRIARPALVAELSQRTVEITTGFTGTQLLVFGATDRLLGPQPDGSPGDDVLVIAQNAPEPMIVRRKIQVLGLWINGPSARFRSVPGFYAVTGTRPLREMLSLQERATKHLGLDQLPLQSTGVQDADYREALLRLKQDSRQWQEQETPMHIAGSRLFRARLDLPATVQTGDYQVQVLLIREGRVVARQELGFEVDRVGVAARIADVAEEQPLVYGLLCILLAAFAGWMGSVLFRRS
ncbi:TIGR02186 family protein [Roseomonas marmotae]|uniref:TIGR02186 family protein n=1 Tax=Roseomonas marmotae TaxID=2768161 RepID=A0ABS3KBW8_9PROT|nr:TIGR02186 family protein [Roseomonas marmotae]MBO1074966.1 TIGR02186 family protein [Roseomonas marmotae]QTI79993.1 TIGR02186 family protein [Roseomonas marmotae]